MNYTTLDETQRRVFLSHAVLKQPLSQHKLAIMYNVQDMVTVHLSYQQSNPTQDG